MKDQQIKDDKRPFIENIDEIYQKINFYKKSLISGLVCVVFQTITILCLIFSSPIVIVEKDGERLGYVGEKKELVVTEGDIKELARKFIKNRYEWQEFDPDYILSDLSPIVQSGLKDKIRKKLIKRQDDLKGQKVSQYVGKIKIHIDEKKRIIGVFDKILRVENIPLISEAQVLIGIVKGFSNKANKIGLYINSVVNYESK